MTSNIHFQSFPHSVRLRMRNVADRSCRQNQNAHFIFRKLNRKPFHLWDNKEKIRIAGEVTDDNITHAHLTLDILGYKHTNSV